MGSLGSRGGGDRAFEFTGIWGRPGIKAEAKALNSANRSARRGIVAASEDQIGRTAGPIRLPAKLLAAGALFHSDRVLLWGESKPTLYRVLRLLHLVHEPLIEQALNWVVLDVSRPGAPTVSSAGIYEAEPTDRRANLWCGGSSFLPDGRLLLIGGDDDPKLRPDAISHALSVTRIVDPASPPPGFGPAPDMRYPRWYPGLLALPDGRSLASFGIALWLEAFDPTAGTWTTLASTAGIDPGGLFDDYPWTFALPDGRVLLVGAWGPETYTFDPASGQIARAGEQMEHAHRHGGTAILLQPEGGGRVLLIGGGAHFQRQLRTVEIFDVLRNMWSSGRSMGRGRRHLGAVLLPTGEVFVTGGGGGRFHLFPSRRSTELYDPARDEWRPAARLRRARGYHHTALLLPDGAVLVAGEKPTAEVYYPPYFFQGPRPRIRIAPASITYGSRFDVDHEYQAGDPVEGAVLVRQGTMTHSFTSDQRVVTLPTTTSGPGRVSLDPPARASLAPPGYYLLFLLSRARLPSERGEWVRLS